MLTAPITATRHALAKAGMTVQDIDLFECNEAFASVVLAFEGAALSAPHARRVMGGAVTFGIVAAVFSA